MNKITQKNCIFPNFFLPTRPYTSHNLVQNILSDQLWAPLLYVGDLQENCFVDWKVSTLHTMAHAWY